MIQRSKVLVAGAMMLGVMSLGGCATKKFVRQEVGVVSTRVDAQETKLSGVEKTAQDALARADAAGKLAEGKFNYSMVLSDDSMKFQPGKAALTPEASARLDAFADKLKSDNKNVYVEVQGHTSLTEGGSKQAAYDLGNKRAEIVRRYLNQKGVPLNRIGTISYGSDAPVAPNTDRAGREANRRVVLIVLS
jgi:outer membrane protein OmpA-like peptidoglycan-associated protein